MNQEQVGAAARAANTARMLQATFTVVDAARILWDTGLDAAIRSLRSKYSYSLGVSSSRLLRRSAPLAAAPVGAPPHVLPVARPLAAPDKGATAGGAALLGQLGLLPGAAHARSTHQPRSASRADQARVRAQLVVISD